MKTERIYKFVMLSLIAIFFSSNVQAQFPTLDYDIYSVNVKTGLVQQVTSIPGAGEFNPDWSPDGSMILHDVVTFTSQDLFITELATGVSTLVATQANDGVWSPDGYTIAYDDFWGTVHILDLVTGTTSSISDAVDPDYSNKTWLLAFHRPSDGMIYSLDLITGVETAIASGYNPAWSKNGQYIAFADGGDIFKQKMHPSGTPIGAPVALTSSPGDDESQPTWSQNGKKIVFHSGNAGTESYDIYSVSTNGGLATYLAGIASQGEFDPDYSHNGRYVAFAGYTDPIAPIITLPIAEKINDQLVIYPNPASDFLELEIKSGNDKPITFELFDIYGKRVFEGVIDSQKMKIDISTLKSGAYFYRLSNSDDLQSGQIIIH
jgi:Tol biopolymer transport system component